MKREKNVKIRKTHPKIIITAVAALACIGLALKFHWLFIIPALVLWWVNKKAINELFTQ